MKKTKPHIDYKNARVLAWMYDFINEANGEREKIRSELQQAINWLEIIRDRLEPVKNPDDEYAHFERCYFTNTIARLRHDAREAGLTSTLFEKLKDRKFRDRFTGWGGLNEPVTEGEIKDRYDVD